MVAFISTLGVILSASYMLKLYKRVFLGGLSDNLDKKKEFGKSRINNAEKSNGEEKNSLTVEPNVEEKAFNLKENKDKLFESESIKSLFDTFDCRILEIEKENQE